MNTEITALDKHLRDGRHLQIHLVPHPEDHGFWMQATLDGQRVPATYIAPVERDASPVPGLPHVIKVLLSKSSKMQPVGLTEAEADGIAAAKQEWGERPVRRAREAAPNAPTWKEKWFTVPPTLGSTQWVGDRLVTILDRTSTWIPEDGRSFNLDAEEGYLWTATVRAATEEEAATLSL